MKYALKAIRESDDIYLYRNHIRIGTNPSLKLHRPLYTFWEWRRLEAAARKRLREYSEEQCRKLVEKTSPVRGSASVQEERVERLEKKVANISADLSIATNKGHVHSELLRVVDREQDEIVKRLEALEEAQKPKRGRPAKRKGSR